MVAEPARSRVDERAMGAGTTVRFALLVVLLLVSSATMTANVTAWLSDTDSVEGFACLLATGMDPNDAYSAAGEASFMANVAAYEACIARHERPLPWWIRLAWPALLVVLASVLFWCLHLWKARRGRVVPLTAIDRDGEILRTVESLAASAGLARTPNVVVDPAAASTGAVVFGRNRRPTVCLHGGLLARRATDPEAFRAVLLHEFAHIRNGDVTLAYATVAVWRVFLAVVLLPYVVWWIIAFPGGPWSPEWSGAVPMATRNLVLAVFLVALIHLARSDVLRSREIYADLAAARWGADPRPWAVATPGPPEGRLRRLGASFVELWRTHPRWDLRREALDDPAVLFGLRSLPMFLTGVAATLINSQVRLYLSMSDLTRPWLGQVAAVAAAGLVTGLVGVALWRAVAHAVLTGRRVPSGLRAGLWLGTGMMAGELVLNDIVLTEWLPQRPAILVLVVLAGTAFTWWVAQCAHLWLRAWPGRTIRPVMLAGLASACLVLSAWFTWWREWGSQYLNGPVFDTRALLERDYPGEVTDHPAAASVIGIVHPLLHSLDQPLVLPMVAALWAVPLLAWTSRRATATLRWVPGALREPAAAEPPVELPPLRGMLGVAALGGVSGWVAVAGAAAYMHSWQPPRGQRGGLYLWIYEGWVLVALVTAATAAAVAASVVASRHRLLIAIITAELAALIGLCGWFVLLSFDGCVPLLNTLASSCQWRPAAAWPLVQLLVGQVLVVTAVTAVIAAATVSAIRQVWTPGGHHAAKARPAREGRGGLVARRLCVGVLCAAAVGVTVLEEASLLDMKRSSKREAAANVQLMVPVGEPPAVSAETRAMQVLAWKNLGAGDLVRRYADALERLGTAQIQAADAADAANSARAEIDPATFRPICADIGQVARDADRYFRVPDPQGQVLWRRFIEQAAKGSQECQQSLDQGDSALFTASNDSIAKASDALTSLLDRTDVVLRDGGLRRP
ncbi:M48 family metalloprotease [Micromonospora sp. NPDC049460]|uniref:M48 family metalloprotease n=1 Tax=Micromonospora sp. NPDC049460 TaxID=3364272 RepID=UPI0037A85740